MPLMLLTYPYSSLSILAHPRISACVRRGHHTSWYYSNICHISLTDFLCPCTAQERVNHSAHSFLSFLTLVFLTPPLSHHRHIRCKLPDHLSWYSSSYGGFTPPCTHCQNPHTFTRLNPSSASLLRLQDLPFLLLFIASRAHAFFSHTMPVCTHYGIFVFYLPPQSVSWCQPTSTLEIACALPFPVWQELGSRVCMVDVCVGMSLVCPFVRMCMPMLNYMTPHALLPLSFCTHSITKAQHHTSSIIGLGVAISVFEVLERLSTALWHSCVSLSAVK